MANVAFGQGSPDDVFTSDAQAAAIAAIAAAEAAEAALDAINAALAAQTLDDHFDVSSGGAIADDIILYDGASWNNVPHVLSSLSDADTSGASDLDLFQLNSGIWNAVDIPTIMAAYMLLSGGTMTGFLTLSADPTNLLHATTKQYVDSVSSGSLYDIGFFIDGIPASLQDRRFVAPRAFSIPGGASGSQAVSRVATTGIYTADIQRNGSSIGTITWAAVATVATIVMSGGTPKAFVAGDVLSIVMSVTPDATADDITVTIAATL